jgi:pimeloyl-ACP methyl ester carboxylesterase
MPPRQIHTLHRPATLQTDAPDLLFVHGAYMDSRCWDIHFLPYFSALGYNCHALDLTAHGLSEGQDEADRFGIDDYAADLRQVIASLPGELVLIGHSMGCTVIERALEKTSARAAVLMAPVPPTGTGGSIMRLALKHPEMFSEITRLSQHGELGPTSLSLMRDIYFSPVTRPEELLDFAHLIQPEPVRAISDMLVVGLRQHRPQPRLPVMVIGGERDAVFPPFATSYTALRWRARQTYIPDCGHMLMLEHQWRAAADAVARWLEATIRRHPNARSASSIAAA